MSSMSAPPKSILKKSSSSVQDPVQEAESAKDRHYATALHHANLIQQQKDLEKLILDNMLTLLDLPRSPDADPANPSSEDAQEFKTLVANLRPQDYDDLIEERNASKLCGYGLCPRKNVSLKGEAKYKLVFSPDEGIKPVAKKELERWCSPECARRALYIKVQLIEEPAWTKQAGRSSQIDLMVDESTKPSFSLPFRPKHYDAQDAMHGRSSPNTVVSPQQNYGVSRDNENKLLNSKIVENRVIKGVIPPSLDSNQNHTAVEGYEPKDYHSSEHRDQKDEGDRDWDL